MTASLGTGLDRADARIHPPAWVRSLIEPMTEAAIGTDRASTPGIRVVERDGFALTSVRIDQAVALDAEEFRLCTIDAYLRLGQELSRLEATHPIRWWNFVPAILEPLGGLPHRYMVFNQGRYAAFEQWHEQEVDYFRRLATASAVGHDGHALEIHCLSSRRAGVAVENPRQISAYCYSRQYGPLPPCFARAIFLEETAADGEPILLIGGTASVVGERSAHPLRLDRQIDETCRNLRSLISAAITQSCGSACSVSPGDPLDLLDHVRIYFVRHRDRGDIETMARTRFGGMSDVEVVRAQLCRPELLVEIEGLAVLQRSQNLASEKIDNHRTNGFDGVASRGHHRS